MDTSNPALRRADFTRSASGAHTMSLSGTIAKSLALLALTFATTLYTWSNADTLGDVGTLFLGSVVGVLVVGGLTMFRPVVAPITAPIFAVLEGLALGILSSLYSDRVRGVLQDAIALTLVVFGAVLVLYGMRVARADGRVRATIVITTFAVAMYYALDLALWAATGMRAPLMASSDIAGIGFSCFVGGLAAVNLVIDFDAIEEGVAAGAPKHLEWYSGFSLLVTLVWLYLEILRLLRRLRNRYASG